MSDTMTGTDLMPSAAPAVTKRSKPTLITLDGRRDVLCSDTRFHRDLAVEYLRTHGRTRWIEVGELARVFMGRNSLDGKRRVRRGIADVRVRLLAFSDFLVTETGGPRHQVQRVKLLDLASASERQAAKVELQKMHARREVSAQRFELALRVIELQENLAAQRPVA